MMQKKIIFLLLASVAINIALVLRVFYLGATITYGTDEINHKARQIQDVEKLLPLAMKDFSREQIKHIAYQAGLETIDKQEDGLYVGFILFSFKSNKVIGVTLH